MAKIYIDKTIYVRDKFKVKRQAFMAGTEVDQTEYYSVLSRNAVLNPEDLPIKNGKVVKRSLASRPIETKDLVVEEAKEATKEVVAEQQPEEAVEPKEIVVQSEEFEAPKKRGRRKKSDDSP